MTHKHRKVTQLIYFRRFSLKKKSCLCGVIRAGCRPPAECGDLVFGHYFSGRAQFRAIFKFERVGTPDQWVFRLFLWRWLLFFAVHRTAFSDLDPLRDLKVIEDNEPLPVITAPVPFPPGPEELALHEPGQHISSASWKWDGTYPENEYDENSVRAWIRGQGAIGAR